MRKKLRIFGHCYLYPIPYKGVEVLGRCKEGRDYCAVSREGKYKCYHIRGFKGYKVIIKGNPTTVGVYEIECDSYSEITPQQLEEIVQETFLHPPFL